MSIANGSKQYIYAIKYQRRGEDGPVMYLVKGDHDPSAEELDALLDLGYSQMSDTIEAQRYDIDALPQLPSKGTK